MTATDAGRGDGAGVGPQGPDLQRIKERLARATPGPWRVPDYAWGGRPWTITAAAPRPGQHELYVAEVSQSCPEGYAYDNAAFIAHARRDVAELVAEVERLRASLAALAQKERPLPAFAQKLTPIPLRRAA